MLEKPWQVMANYIVIAIVGIAGVTRLSAWSVPLAAFLLALMCGKFLDARVNKVAEGWRKAGQRPALVLRSSSFSQPASQPSAVLQRRSPSGGRVVPARMVMSVVTRFQLQSFRYNRKKRILVSNDGAYQWQETAILRRCPMPN
jgi:hypothetical protein